MWAGRPGGGGGVAAVGLPDDGHASDVGAVAFPTPEPVSRGIATAEPVSQGGESPG